MTNTIIWLQQMFSDIFITYSWGHPLLAGLFATYLFYLFTQDFEMPVGSTTIILFGLAVTITPILIPLAIVGVLFLILSLVLFIGVKKLWGR